MFVNTRKLSATFCHIVSISLMADILLSLHAVYISKGII